MTSSTPEVLAALEIRHGMDADVLTQHIAANFSGSLLSLRQLKPFIEEILRQFKHLPKKKSVDGTYPAIAGYRTFNDVPAKCLTCHKAHAKRKPATHAFVIDPQNTGRPGWCWGVLHRKPRTVDYMLAGGNKHRTKKETVSTVPDAVAILEYVENHASDISIEQRKILAAGLEKVATRLKRSVK
jgi:hypothetical protein